MMRYAGIVFLLVAVVLVSGCFDYAEKLVIKADGSGQMTVHYAMDKEYLEQMEQMRLELVELLGGEDTAGGALTEMWSEELVRAALQEQGQGAKLLTYEESENETSRMWDMTFSFEDINQLHVVMDALYEDQEDEFEEDIGAADEPDETPELIYVQQDDGTWLFTRPMGDDESDIAEEFYDEEDAGYDDDFDDDYAEEDTEDASYEEDDMSAAADEMTEELTAMFEGHSVKVEVVFPGKVIESNATHVDGNTAVWEYALTEIEQVKELRAVIAP